MQELNSGPPKTNPSSGREEDLNPGPPAYKCSALTTRPRSPPRLKFNLKFRSYDTVSFSVDYGQEFDYLFIQFYNNYCYPGDQYFLPVIDTWLQWARSVPNGPLIVLGLPAGPQAAGKPHYYFPPDKLVHVYKVSLHVILLTITSSEINNF